jgi:hypothetical protein
MSPFLKEQHLCVANVMNIVKKWGLKPLNYIRSNVEKLSSFTNAPKQFNESHEHKT